MRSCFCDELLPVVAVRVEGRRENEDRRLGRDGDKVRVAGVRAVAELDVGDGTLHFGVRDDLDGLEGVVVVEIDAPCGCSEGDYAFVGIDACESALSGNGLNLLFEI